MLIKHKAKLSALLALFSTIAMRIFVHMRMDTHTDMGCPIHIWAANMDMGTHTRMAAPYAYGQ